MYSLEEVQKFRETYGKRKLILDTNLLILLIVGTVDRSKISSCDLTSSYSADDFDALNEVFRFFISEIVITPHILAELSNLCGKLPDTHLHYYFSVIVSKLKTFSEEHVGMVKLVCIDFPTLLRFGFPDMGVVEAALQCEGVIITADLNLQMYAATKGVPAINFDSLRIGYAKSIAAV